MVHQDNQKNQNEVLIKLLAHHKLKHALEELAGERDVALTCPYTHTLSQRPFVFDYYENFGFLLCP
jgi:hypothetical protein